ncbi:PREDICTED: NAC domain-containing protein 83-like [Ipomoea nil]|uniref:NAC domain-containing protein 83-like n=1 Tax=Ipomoea nil TaxID=35883 RepID=UPI000901DCEF|nr:PREDICTED: NAC domain-containing protein 83-like [Ipomoea nil]
MDGRLRLHFVRDDGKVVKLPPGFRFQPTEQEIVFQYLQRKTFSLSLPASVISELPNICRYDPWNLPGDMEQEDRYFFSSKEATKYPNGDQTSRVSSNGYWKPSSSEEKHITCPGKSSSIPMIMGMKKTLVFYYGKPPHGSKTNWIMHEYRLVAISPAGNPPLPPYFLHAKKDYSQGSLMQQIGNLVICHVFQKKRVNGKAGEESAEVCGDNINISINEGENIVDNAEQQLFERYNLMMRDGLSSSSCSDDGDSCVSSCSSSRVLNDEVSSSHSCGTWYGNHQDANYI